MKKLIRYSTFAFMAAVAMLTASCTEEYEYDPAEATKDNSKVTLAAESQSYTFNYDETPEFDITVKREKTDAAETVKLYCDNEKVTVPSEVSFAAGEGEQSVHVSANLESGETAVAIISVDEESANLYGDYKLDFTIYRDFKWTKVGQVAFYDFTFSSNGAGAYVDIEKFDGDDYTYRLVKPYSTVYASDGAEGGDNIIFTVNEDGSANAITDNEYAFDSNGVFGYTMYYNAARYSSYCYFANQGNIYYASFILRYGSSLYTGGYFQFQWTAENGCPLK